MVDRGRPEDIWVAFSFAGKERDRVEAIATALEKRLGRGRVFYDIWFEAALNGTEFLPKLERTYEHTAALVVPCLSADYELKFWTKAERAAIANRRIRKAEEVPGQSEDWIFLLRVGAGQVTGFGPSMLFSQAQEPRSIEEIVELIITRLLIVSPELQSEITFRDSQSSTLSGHQINTLVMALTPYQQFLDSAWLGQVYHHLTLSVQPVNKDSPLTDLLIGLLEQTTATQLTCIELIRQRLKLDGHTPDGISDWQTSLSIQFATASEVALKRAPIEMLKLQNTSAILKSAIVQVIVDVDDQGSNHGLFLVATRQAASNGVIHSGIGERVKTLSEIPALFAAEFKAQSAQLNHDENTRFEFIVPLDILALGLGVWNLTKGKRQTLFCSSYISYLRSYELKYVEDFRACNDEAKRLWQQHCCTGLLSGWHMQRDIHQLSSVASWNPIGAVCGTGFTPCQGAKLIFEELVYCGTPISMLLSSQGDYCAALTNAIALKPHAEWAQWVFEHHRDPAARTLNCDHISLYYDNPNDPVPQLPGRKNNGRFYAPTLRKIS